MSSRCFRLSLLMAGASLAFTAPVNSAASPQAPTAKPEALAGAPSAPRTVTVLVFPFEDNSHLSNLDWIGDGLAELTAERLEERGFSVLSRQDRLAAIEKIGLPSGSPFSHATMVKIAAEADADELVFGSYVSDGKSITFRARVLHMSPPGLSDEFARTAALPDLVRAHAQFVAALQCALERKDCAAPVEDVRGPDPASLPGVDALENFVHGILAMDDEARLRGLREAARLAPGWDRPAFELGEVYFAKRECESALPWFSRVPPDRPDGAEAAFNSGVCHLLRNDPNHAEAAFSALLERATSTDAADRLPELAQAHNNLGVARLRMMKWSDAEAEFKRAAELDELEPDYLVNLGIARLAENQPALAIEPLQRAMMMDPLDKGAQSLVTSTLAALGQSDDADAKPPSGPRSGPRSSAPGTNANGGTPSALPDPVELVRLARIAAHFDRSVLRPAAVEGGAPAADGDPSRSGSLPALRQQSVVQ